MLKRLFSWFQVVYPLVLVTIHGLTLHGPYIFGWRPFLARFVAAGLAGVIGTHLCNSITASLVAGGRTPDAVRTQMILCFGVPAVIVLISHITYFDGTHAVYGTALRFAHIASVALLSFLLRGLLAALPKEPPSRAA